ncbi:hypothetical protein M3Y98_01030600 [Aphelenchoides besseyi]|nr:hypothetical protein M3Y98_01030600 [Aphelenchoides besseyi]KAI6209976.1 hypothetical protein M3Y96_00278000 [Aphelenchoides besseyi]
MNSRTNGRTQKLTDDSARLLEAFHRQKKQNEVSVQPYDEQVLKLIDLLIATRVQWKTERNLRIAAEEQIERMERGRTNFEGQIKEKDAKILKLQEEVLGHVNRQKFLDEQVEELKQKLESIRPLIEKTLKNTPDYDAVMKLTRMSRPMPPIQEIRQTRRTAQRQEEPMEYIDDTSSLNTEEEVHLRYNRTYRRSHSQEPESRHQRISHTKRTRTSRYDAIDEEQENEDPRIRAPSAKRSRDLKQMPEGEITTVTKIIMDPKGLTPTRASVEVRRSKKRSVSASRVLDDKPNSARRQLIGPSPHLLAGISTSDLRRTPRTPTGIGNSWTRGRPIEDCTHRFEPYKKNRLLTAIMQTTCGYCYLSLSSVEKKAVLCADCQVIFHDRCKLLAQMPCIPFGVFPSGPLNKKGKSKLKDLVPNSSPCIPVLLIRCIYALEQNRLETEGLYRIPGASESVLRVYKDFMDNKFIPDLTSEPTEVICSCVKLFLSKLEDSLIPRSSYSEFVNNAEIADIEQRHQTLQEIFYELPYPNQDTLAYLLEHLQRVASCASQNRMPIKNLAGIFAPTLLTNPVLTKQQAVADNQRKITAVQALLEMPCEFWSDHLKKRTMSTAPTALGVATPRTHRQYIDFRADEKSGNRVDQSVLGPITRTPPKGFTPRSRTPGRIGPF